MFLPISFQQKNREFYDEYGPLVTRKVNFLFLNQNICCGYSKERSRWDVSFEHLKHMVKIIGKKIFTILR